MYSLYNIYLFIKLHSEIFQYNMILIELFMPYSMYKHLNKNNKTNNDIKLVQ